MSWAWDSSMSWVQRFFIKVMKSGPIPRHIAFIMDGNRRYAVKNSVQKIVGHMKGSDKLDETVSWCRELGVEEVTVYAFSIDNFKRTAEEVAAILELFRQKFQQLLDEREKLHERGIRVRTIGKLSLLPPDIKKMIWKLTAATKHNNQFCLTLAISYTGREEISQAVSAAASAAARGVISAGDITADLISSCLYTSPGSNPELLVRTSGEVRLSDFLLWQSSASLLYFTDTLWPELSLWNLLKILLDYQRACAGLSELREKEIQCPAACSLLAEIKAERERSLLT